MTEALQSRAAVIAACEVSISRAVAELSCASELPVLRRDDPKYGTHWEVLSMAPGDCNLGTLNKAGLLLRDHDETLEIGHVVPDSARVCSDRKLRAQVRFAEPHHRMLDDLLDGKLPNAVSVGYSRLAVVGRETGSDGVPVLRFSWQPHEISILSPGIPAADANVGLGRSANFTMKNNLESLLAAALSGSRRQSCGFTREQLDDEFSLHDLITRKASGFTREVSQSVKHIAGDYVTCFVPFAALLPRHRRDLTAAGGLASGGAFVGTDLHPAIELLMNHTACVRLGAQVAPGLTGNAAFPRIETAPETDMVSETGASVETDLGTGQLGYGPCRVTAQINYSMQLLKQTGGGIEDVVRRILADAIGVKVDRMALLGRGDNSEPMGLLQTPGVGSLYLGGVSPTWAKLIQFEKTLADSNADRGSLGWAITPSTRASLKSIPRVAVGATTTNSRFLIEGDRMADLPFVATNTLNDGQQILLGSWSEMIIPVWGGGIDFVIDEVTQASRGVVRAFANLWFNIVIRHPQSFVVSPDAGNV